ncbi:MAG: hypothetical protein U1C74_32000 [Phenylobacterium sp.]|uniref:hypothetical protein n=1 Tax=Brevundimonas sp. TaxID=1871086 RepID=UPI00273780E1|nr:hypothetical protein [Brevundimonas sp.]MDP3803480.1 hypothetical protein [Brevundimonas sp.]MDZ4376027.1 hypothetical protein [Phenylobacterium sp.]
MKAMIMFGALALGGALTGCDGPAAARPATPVSEAGASHLWGSMAQSREGVAPMPSPQQKRAMASQIDPRQPLVTPFLSASEALEAKGYLLQFLESPDGSVSERRAWEGFSRYQSLVQARSVSAQQAEDQAATEYAARAQRDEPEARAICTRFRLDPYALSYEEVSQMRDRMAQLATVYPGDLSRCVTEIEFRYLDLVPRTCSASPC